MLAGPLGRARHVEHVVEHLEREPDPAPEAPQHVDRRRPLQRAQLAGGLEQPRGLEVAALLVALARDADVPGVLALQQLALGERRRGVRQHAHRLGHARCAPARRTRARTAGRRSRWRSRGPRRRRRSAGRGAARRRRARRRAPAWPSGSARRRPSPAARAPGAPAPARPRAGPAAAAAACRRPRSSTTRARPAPSPCERASSCSRSSSSSMSPGTCAPPAAITAATASALATQPTVPECRAMMPPAVRIQRTSVSPAPTITVPRSRGPGNRFTELGRYEYAWSSPVIATEQRHDAIEPEREERRQGRLVRRGDLEHHDSAARAHHARHLGQPALEVGEVARAEADRRGVERVVVVRAAPARWPAPSAPPGSSRRARSSMPSEKSEPTTSPPRRGERDRQVAGAGRHVERPRARARRRARSAARSRQRWCSPAVMTEFMTS